jgi:hypothetical protein
MEDNITLTLSREEVEALLKFLGELPISTNAFYLFAKMRDQLNASNTEPV